MFSFEPRPVKFTESLGKEPKMLYGRDVTSRMTHPVALCFLLELRTGGGGGVWWEPYLEHLRQYSSQDNNGNKDVSEHPIPRDSACTYEFLAVFYKLKEDVTKNFEVTPSSRALHVPRPKVPSTSLQGRRVSPRV